MVDVPLIERDEVRMGADREGGFGDGDGARAACHGGGSQQDAGGSAVAEFHRTRGDLRSDGDIELEDVAVGARRAGAGAALDRGGGGVDGGEEDSCGAPQILVSIKECSGVHQCAMDQTLLPIRTNIYISTLEAQYRTPRETDVIYSSASMLSFPSDPTGATATGTRLLALQVQKYKY